jgi:hypothetical protein
MYKLFFIVVCLLLNSNVAEAKFDEDLQKRCVNIVNYKLAGDVGVISPFLAEIKSRDLGH